jgi:hypothetical protein
MAFGGGLFMSQNRKKLEIYAGCSNGLLEERKEDRKRVT